MIVVCLLAKEMFTKSLAWLLEVNGGPSMSANTKEDEILKVGLIDDTMTLINIEGM